MTLSHPGRSRARFAACLGLALTLFAHSAVSQSGADYQARVAVTEESDATRDRALREALMTVLKRAAGRSDVAFSPILGRASQLVQRYGFERDAASGELFFVAAFDPRAVDAALYGQALPAFGVTSGASENAQLLIRGVRGARDYSRVMEQLGGMAGVSGVQVAEVRDDLLLLRVTVQGGSERLLGQLRAGGVMRAEADGSYTVVGSR